MVRALHDFLSPMTLQTHLPDVRDRARAAFLGLAVGDALGATVEFMTPAEIRARHGVHRDIVGGGWLRLRRGEVTDDTEMSLALARSISAQGKFSAPAAAEGFARWLRSRPRDIGNTCRRGIARYLLDGSLEAPLSDGDAGNGAAMRMVPVALSSLANGDLLEQLAVTQARITHHHPLSDAACVLVGRLLHLACLGLSLNRMRRMADAAVARFPPLRFDPYPGLAPGYVADTLATVLHFFFSTASFEECLVAVVNQGGDADTTGAIAGAIAGAYYGPEDIPRRWWRRLDTVLRDEIGALAERMVDLSPLARGAAPSIT